MLIFCAHSEKYGKQTGNGNTPPGQGQSLGIIAGIRALENGHAGFGIA